METITLYNGTKVKVTDQHKGHSYYLCYDSKGQPIDECRNCLSLAYRDDLRGGIDDWACPKCIKGTGEFCECGYEFVIFPDGEDERDLAEVVSVLDSKPARECIDCLEKGDSKHGADSRRTV